MYVLDMAATGRKLREHRLACGYSQRTVSEEIGVGTSDLVSLWERGKNTPRLESLVKLMQLYNVDGIDDLIVIKKEEDF